MRELAEKIGFTEGPVWTGDRLYVTSISRGHIYDVAMDGSGAKLLFETGGGPNGAAMAPDGSLWITQNGGHVVPERPEPIMPPGIQSLRSEVLSYELKGEFQAPNDLAFSPQGDLWFTDPFAPLSREHCGVGFVWKYSPATGDLRRVIETTGHPNGLAFSPLGDALYVTETVRRRVIRIDLHEGEPSSGPAPILDLDGEPDGMAVDVQGDLYISVHDPDNAIIHCDGSGFVVERIAADGMYPTNVCFAGQDLQTLIVTSPRGGRVYALDRDVPGTPLLGQSSKT
jgi:gluconolactonase